MVTQFFVIQAMTGKEQRFLSLVRRSLARAPGLEVIVERSKVVFDENNRIVVREGALQGLEGRIVKVDRRKGRAKVTLDMCENAFLIDLGFELMEPGHKPVAEESS